MSKWEVEQSWAANEITVILGLSGLGGSRFRGHVHEEWVKKVNYSAPSNLGVNWSTLQATKFKFANLESLTLW